MKSVRSWDGCKLGVSPPRWSAADPRGITWISIRATPCIKYFADLGSYPTPAGSVHHEDAKVYL